MEGTQSRKTHLDTWNQFITQFETSFDDTQKVQKARNQLDRLNMKWPEVDQYTMGLREANTRGQLPGSDPRRASEMYLKGLPNDVAADVLGPPLVHDYPLHKTVSSTERKHKEDAPELSKT